MNGFKVNPARLKEIDAKGGRLYSNISNDADKIILDSNNLQTNGGSFNIVVSRLNLESRVIIEEQETEELKTETARKDSYFFLLDVKRKRYIFSSCQF